MTHAEKIKTIVSCLLGNVVEWFDFAIYGYLTPIIADNFFPADNTVMATLWVYLVFAVGFIFRPLGALLLGYIADRKSKKAALVVSSLLMAIPTCLMGCLPTYASIGMLAPLLLMVCRILQGIAIGGECTGSFIYLTEKSTPHRQGFFSSFADMGLFLGMIIGSLYVALLNTTLTSAQMQNFGWRLPFLSGLILSFLAVFLRTNLAQSNGVRESVASQRKPITEIINHYPREFFYSILLITLSTLGFYVLVVFIPNQTVLVGKISANHVYLINSIVLATMMLATFGAACACDRVHPAKIYLTGLVGCLLFSYPVFYCLTQATLTWQLVMTSLFAVALGCCFGSRSLFAMRLFAASVRYSAVGLSFNIATASFGGTAPLLATFLLNRTGSLQSIELLIMLAAWLSLHGMLNLLAKNKLPLSHAPLVVRDG